MNLRRFAAIVVTALFGAAVGLLVGFLNSGLVGVSRGFWYWTLATEQRVAAAGRANARVTIALAIAIVSMVVTVVGISITHIEMEEMNHERLTTLPTLHGIGPPAGLASADRK
jgi:hypothetical protein